MWKNTAGQKWTVFAFNRTTNAPVTGDAANITAKINKGWAGYNAVADAHPAEQESGYYEFDLTQAETNADTLSLIPVSEAGDAVVIACPAVIFTVDPYVRASAGVPGAVAMGGVIPIVRGDDYDAASETTVITAEIAGYAGPAVAGHTRVEFSIGARPGGRPVVYTTEDATAVMDGTTLVLKAGLPTAQSAALALRAYLADWQITLADGSIYTPWIGRLVVERDVTE
ncbi:MAG TPA: hypothetical protein VMW52_05790 [Phycisphaerae bacterium]|nr:hypothetical protein [Phycisphaerae bacterium]